MQNQKIAISHAHFFLSSTDVNRYHAKAMNTVHVIMMFMVEVSKLLSFWISQERITSAKT